MSEAETVTLRTFRPADEQAKIKTWPGWDPCVVLSECKCCRVSSKGAERRYVVGFLAEKTAEIDALYEAFGRSLGMRFWGDLGPFSRAVEYMGRIVAKARRKPTPKQIRDSALRAAFRSGGLEGSSRAED